jgi:hypothetical protein
LVFAKQKLRKCKKLKNKYKKNMTRVKRGNIARKRRKKVLKMTQGFRGSSSVLFRVSNQQYFKGLRTLFVIVNNGNGIFDHCGLFELTLRHEILA